VILTAAVLHDTVEDTETTPEEIEAHFGRQVRALVAEVTDDKTLPKEERKDIQEKHAASSSFEAKVIKFGDKISNVQDLTRFPPAHWTVERRRKYLDWTERVLAGCRGCNAGLEAYYDEVLKEGRRALEAEPAREAGGPGPPLLPQ
jgi:(p)ppGpp synthase/HD superfamily hydrolase